MASRLRSVLAIHLDTYTIGLCIVERESSGEIQVRDYFRIPSQTAVFTLTKKQFGKLVRTPGLKNWLRKNNDAAAAAVTLTNQVMDEELITFPSREELENRERFWRRILFSVEKKTDIGQKEASYIFTRPESGRKVYMAVTRKQYIQRALHTVKCINGMLQFGRSLKKIVIENESISLLNAAVFLETKGETALENVIIAHLNEAWLQVQVVRGREILFQQRIMNSGGTPAENNEYLVKQLVVILAFLKNEPEFRGINTILCFPNKQDYQELFETMQRKLGTIVTISMFRSQHIDIPAAGDAFPAALLAGAALKIFAAPGSRVDFAAGKRLRRPFYKTKIALWVLVGILAVQVAAGIGLRIRAAYTALCTLRRTNENIVAELMKKRGDIAWRKIPWESIAVFNAGPGGPPLSHYYRYHFKTSELLAAVGSAVPAGTVVSECEFLNGYVQPDDSSESKLIMRITGYAKEPYTALRRIQALPFVSRADFREPLKQYKKTPFFTFTLTAQLQSIQEENRDAQEKETR